MTYPSGGPGYPGAQPPGAYAPTTQIARVDAGPSKLPLYLVVGVAILGLATYLFAFGPIWKGDAGGTSATTYGIIATLIAGLLAVVGLLPKQSNYIGVVTVIAVTGFLLTIYDLISHAKDAGWALIVIVVVSALQTVLAIAALLLDAGVISPPAPRQRYDPYQQFGGYYMQQPGQQPQFAQPQAAAPQHQPAPGAQNFGQPQGFPQYGGYPAGPSTGPFPAAPSPAVSPGAPTVYAGAPSTGGYQPQAHAAGPPTPPTGFPTFAPPPPSQQAAPDHQSSLQGHEQPTQEVRLEQQASESPAPPPA